MRIVTRFWRHLAVWTVFMTLVLTLVSLATGTVGGVVARLPVWLGLAFMLAAYPAGVAASRPVLAPADEGGAAALLPSLLVFLLSAAGASVVAFVLANWVGPALLARFGGPPPGGLPDAARMTLGELTRTLGREAPAGRATTTVADWLTYNHLAYHLVRRTDGMLLPALFAGVGLLVGYWTDRMPPSLARPTLWLVGLFLTVSTYLAGENGYELILVRMAGPAEFAADLVLIVPGALILALGLSTVADLVSRRGHEAGVAALDGPGPGGAEAGAGEGIRRGLQG